MAERDGLIYFDRTRVTTDWTCPRRRFWAFEFMGRGISPKRRSIHLEFGSIIHVGFAELLLGEDIEVVVEHALSTLIEQLALERIEEMVDATDQRVREMTYLTEGLLRVLARVVVPKLLEFHRPIRVEEEVLYEHDGCVLMSKPDAILERFEDGALVYPELKTAGGIDEKWQKQWWKAVQLPAGALGVAQTLGRPLASTFIIGANKGYWSKQYERWESPLCYGYASVAEALQGYTDASVVVPITRKYRNGTRKVGAWRGGMTPAQWLEGFELPELEKLVTTVGPIPYQAPMTQAWLRQTAIREHTQREARNQLFGGAPLREAEARRILDTVWPQRFNECQSGWGSDCSYCDACFIPSVERDPIASGLYEWRTAHHSTDPICAEEAA